MARYRPIQWLVVTLLQESSEDSICVTNSGVMFLLISRIPPVATNSIKLCGPEGAECYGGNVVKVEPTTGSASTNAALMVAVANAGLCEGVLFSQAATWQALATRIPIESIELSCSEFDSFLVKKQKIVESNDSQEGGHGQLDERDRGDEEEDPEVVWERGIMPDYNIPILFRKEDFISKSDTAAPSDFVIDTSVLTDATLQDMLFKLANGVVVGCNRITLATSSEFFKGSCWVTLRVRMSSCLKHLMQLRFKSFFKSSCQRLATKVSWSSKSI